MTLKAAWFLLFNNMYGDNCLCYEIWGFHRLLDYTLSSKWVVVRVTTYMLQTTLSNVTWCWRLNIFCISVIVFSTLNKNKISGACSTADICLLKFFLRNYLMLSTKIANNGSEWQSNQSKLIKIFIFRDCLHSSVFTSWNFE